MSEQAKQSRCLAFEENKHAEAYLTHVNQGDGTRYFKCEMCGWIKVDNEVLETRLKEAEAVIDRQIEEKEVLKMELASANEAIDKLNKANELGNIHHVAWCVCSFCIVARHRRKYPKKDNPNG